MRNFIRKHRPTRYWSSRIILLIDLAISFMASLLAVLLTSGLLKVSLNHEHFIIAWLLVVFLGSGLSFLAFRTFRNIIRYSTLRGLGKLEPAVFVKEALLLLLLCFYPDTGFSLATIYTLALFDLLLSLVLLIVARICMVVGYEMLIDYIRRPNKALHVAVYGTSEKAVALVTQLQNSNSYKIVAFLTNDKSINKHNLADKPVLYYADAAEVAKLKEKYDVDAILFTSDVDARKEEHQLLAYANQNNLKILISPPIDEMVDGKPVKSSIREIKIEDILGREEIKINMPEIAANFKGKVVLVTGAAGSIGSELCRQVASIGVEKLILFDNAETPMHNLRLELEDRFPQLQFVPIVGDIRQSKRLDYAFRDYKPQVVFHAAAYKHVPLMEENPCEAVYVNVVGARNVANKCIEYGVEKMVMISTDKAVNPTNIMGCTKRLAEIYVQSLGLAIEQGKIEGKTCFVTTRFGNVLGSNGSVIPRFREQIAAGGPLTVTHPDITRFFMTIPEACRLVLEAATLTRNTRIFVFDMGESVKIAHLATRMIELAGLVPNKDIKIEYTGLRPGEKLYEEVLSNEENTIPTTHHRMHIAKVREYSYAEAAKVVEQLEEYALAVDIEPMVRYMKEVVPEFKSKNSPFEKLDQ